MNAADPRSVLTDEASEHDDRSECSALDTVEPFEPEPTERALSDDIFSGSRFMFWSVGPLSAFSGISLLGTIDDPWSQAGAMKLLLGAFGILFALALASPRRFDLAARGVTAIVFLLCLCYVVDEWLAYQQGSRQGQASSALASSIRAFLAFGVPSLWLTLRRRAR